MLSIIIEYLGGLCNVQFNLPIYQFQNHKFAYHWLKFKSKGIKEWDSYLLMVFLEKLTEQSDLNWLVRSMSSYTNLKLGISDRRVK